MTRLIAAAFAAALAVPAAAQEEPSSGLACALEALRSGAPAERSVTGAHALSMHGDVKYGPDFDRFDYTSPDATKGGEVTLAAIGSYDSLNGFILKGVGATGLGLIYDSLLTGSADEPFTEYGLLVESIDMPADRSWVEFTLRGEARWHDGEPVTPGRCRLDLRDASHERPSVLPAVLRRRGVGGGDGAALGALRLRRHG